MRGVSENCKVLTSEQSLQSDDSINSNILIKYAIRVTGLRHKMPSTPSLVQARRSTYSVCTKRMEEEKARKEKDMQQNAKTAKEDPDTQNTPKELESRKRSLSEVHKTITKKEAT